MAISWFFTTVLACFVAILIEYVSDKSNFTALTIASGLITIITINTLFWLPLLSYLHKKQKISLLSSLMSSISVAAVGSAVSIGVIILLMKWVSTENATRYTEWKLGHVHVAQILILWGINGLIFWVLYGKFTANKAN